MLAADDSALDVRQRKHRLLIILGFVFVTVTIVLILSLIPADSRVDWVFESAMIAFQVRGDTLTAFDLMSCLGPDRYARVSAVNFALVKRDTFANCVKVISQKNDMIRIISPQRGMLVVQSMIVNSRTTVEILHNKSSSDAIVTFLPDKTAMPKLDAIVVVDDSGPAPSNKINPVNCRVLMKARGRSSIHLTPLPFANDHLHAFRKIPIGLLGFKDVSPDESKNWSAISRISIGGSTPEIHHHEYIEPPSTTLYLDSLEITRSGIRGKLSGSVDVIRLGNRDDANGSIEWAEVSVPSLLSKIFTRSTDVQGSIALIAAYLIPAIYFICSEIFLVRRERSKK